MRKLIIAGLLSTYYSSVYATEWSGNLAIQDRLFFNSPLELNEQQHDQYLSISVEPELYTAWDNKNQSFTFTPFFRADQHDQERTHGDIRELVWQVVFDGWEIKAGITKVFWGVTESQHLVDVINQTDNVENIDGEDKLGQPMISVSIEKDWGLIDLFLLPYFRERNYFDIEGRPRPYPVVDGDHALYETTDEEQHIDYAARIFYFLGNLELGLSYFNGTSREPTFIMDSTNNVLLPFYRQMNQFGIDAQITTDEWLWKTEIIRRTWSAKDFLAATAGFEYTYVGIFNSDADLGLVAEYLYDDRQELASSYFQNDVLIGLRYTMNDSQSTEALLGFITDVDNREVFISLEASRRLSSNWTMSIELREFSNVNRDSSLYQLRKDGFIQIEAACYF